MTPPTSPIPVFGIVPAAGSGRRMGRPKQLLPCRGSTMLAGVVRTLLDAGLNAVVVVTRRELAAGLDLPADARLSLALNDDPSSEMIDSIRIGLSALFTEGESPGGAESNAPGPVPRVKNCAGILVVPGDMPALSVATCRLCMESYRRQPGNIIVAGCASRRGHPLIFPAEMQSAVRGLRGGLNTLLALHPDRVRQVETGDPAALADVDTWEQYRALVGTRPTPDASAAVETRDDNGRAEII